MGRDCRIVILLSGVSPVEWNICPKSRLAVVLNKETSSSYLITHFQVTLYRFLRVLYFYELRRLQNSMISQVRSLASLKSSLKQNRKLVRKLNRGKPRNEDLEYAQLP